MNQTIPSEDEMEAMQRAVEIMERHGFRLEAATTANAKMEMKRMQIAVLRALEERTPIDA